MKDWDTQEAAKLSLLGSAESEAPVRVQLLDKMTGQILFEAKEANDNLLEKKFLLEIEQFENKIKAMMEAKWTKLCWAKSITDTNCNENAWMSPLKFLGGTRVSDWDQADINKTFWTTFVDKTKAVSSDDQQQLFHDSYVFPTREKIASTGKVTFMRTIINFGAPLEIDG